MEIDNNMLKSNKDIDESFIGESDIANGAYAEDEEEYIYNDTFIQEEDEYEYIYEEPLISLYDVVKEYDNGTVKALNGINLDIYEGEFVSIIGPSGSGKSTLLNMLGALDKPTSGEIYIDGIDLIKEKDLSDFRRDKIGFVFQLHNLIPNLSVLDNVQMPLMSTDMSHKEMKEKASEIIASVGLEDKKKQKPNKLSGGQRQRVAIARALVNDPSIILADEPTGSLDSKTGDMILDLLRAMHDVFNVTLIIVTHDNHVANLAERTIKIKDGRIIEDRLNY